MSDLQCPVRLLLWPPPGPAPAALRGVRVAAVLCGGSGGLLEPLAPVRAHPGLRVPGAGESAEAVTDRACEAFGEVADLYRGETVVVVADERLLAAATGRLAGTPVPDRAGWPLELSGDADGWTLAGR